MLLKEYLKTFTKDQLLKLARCIDIKRYSGLKKEALIDKIAEDFCTEEIMRRRLACLTKEQMQVFRKACKEPQKNSGLDMVEETVLYMSLLGQYDETTDAFSVFEDVAGIFSRIDDDDFREDQKKKGWMIKCLAFFDTFYGVAPLEIIYKLYTLKVKDTFEDMMTLLEEIPVDISRVHILQKKISAIHGSPKYNPLGTSRGLMISVPILVDNEYDDLLKEQADKEYYIPSAWQIEEIYRESYEASSPAYRKLESFFIQKLNLPYDKSKLLCAKIWGDNYMDRDVSETMDDLFDEGVDFQSEKLLEKFLALLSDANNNTRMLENRGHTPDELFSYEPRHGKPVIVPGSSHAAKMLQEAAPYLEKNGIPYDLNGNADTIASINFSGDMNSEPVIKERKIYPNDPCPCGSGKKYKKCCGRK